MLALLPALLGLTASTSAVSATPFKRDTYADCWSFNSDIYAQTSTNIDLASVIGYPANQQVLVQSTIDQYKAGSTIMQQINAAKNITVNGTYSMYFEFCQPKNGGNITGVFQTHHGLVGNAGYWNVNLDGTSNNSFADAAASAGWATLSYDRLGVGRSAHPDGTNVVQISYEIAQSVAISKALRNGTLGNGVPSFFKVVGVGHSYGSNLLTGLVATSPNAFDQIVLTGFTNNVTMGPLGLAGFMSTITNVAYPNRFAGQPNDHVITPSISNDQMEFFHYPNYSSTALTQFTNNKGEYTLGQQNTIASTYKANRSAYSKPTFVVTGNNDAPYCTADCHVTSLGANATQLDTVKPLFPGVSASNYGYYIVPDTGHGINYHTTAMMAYEKIISFVASH